MKKRSETQTLRAGCSKAEPTIFAPPQTPFPGARGGQNLISWKQTNPVWRGSIHAISSYRGNRPTNTPTNRHDRLQYTAPQFSAPCKNRTKKRTTSGTQSKAWRGWCTEFGQVITALLTLALFRTSVSISLSPSGYVDSSNAK